jgi:NAD(P)-dependent dehydrogenase (short-subunit alcohol dehydrogenase family)
MSSPTSRGRPAVDDGRTGELVGKVALVTGSAIGLGAAIARRLAREGARVVVTGLPEERGRALVEELGARAVFIPADLTDVEQTQLLARRAIETCGGLDILVNNAAVSERAEVTDVTPALFDRHFHVIVRAPLLLVREALPSLRAREGVVINIGSVNAAVGWQNLVVYAAAKGALVTASKNLANALKYTRVRVHCLNPGWIDTEGERAAMQRLGHPSDFLEREGERLPLGRLLRPEEIAEAAAFFASPRAAAFSGAVIELEQFPIGALCHPRHTEPMQ